MNINDVIKKIKHTTDNTINILKDIILDYRKICRKQRIIITIFSLLNILLFVILILVKYSII